MRTLLALALLLSGCTTQRIDHLAAALNERNVQSCIVITGSYAMFVGIHLVTATGGATLEQCHR